MKNSLFFRALFVGASAFIAGCSNSDDLPKEVQPPNLQLWNASVHATLDSIDISNTDNTTRALFIGGNTDRFLTTWDDGDVVRVYKGDTEVGTLTPAPESWFTLNNTILNGTLTGPFAIGDELKLYLPSRDIDYTGQDGSLNNMSLRYSFRDATTTVAEAQDQILTMRDVSMTHRQTYWRMMLTDESGKRLHMERVEISSVSGKIVLSKPVGGETSYGTLIVNAVQKDKEYPAELFVALGNDNVGNDTYMFKAVVGADVYVGPSDRALTYTIGRGGMANIIRQMRKTTAASTLTITDIPEKVFTGYAITPTLTVKDGETTLTLDTDYSVAYTDNVNAGTATATITGLAEQGTTCTTPYLGTQDKTFTIVQAVPVIVLDDSQVTLTYGGSGNTRTVTRVFIDNNANGTWDEGTDYDITNQCTVTYSSGTTSTATVDPSTGAVLPAGQGTTTITATVATAQNWTTATASYSVKVDNKADGTLSDYSDPDDSEWSD